MFPWISDNKNGSWNVFCNLPRAVFYEIVARIKFKFCIDMWTYVSGLFSLKKKSNIHEAMLVPSEWRENWLLSVFLLQAASPAITELEYLVTDWLAKMLALPSHFLHAEYGPGGGVTQVATINEIMSWLLYMHYSLICCLFNTLRTSPKIDGIWPQRIIPYIHVQVHAQMVCENIVLCKLFIWNVNAKTINNDTPVIW